jgi:hypothetical protein
VASDSLEEFFANTDEEGTHTCVVDSAELITGKDGRVWCKFGYVVNDETNDLDGEEFTEMFQDFSHLKREDLATLSSEDRGNARKAFRRKQARLMSLGVPEDKTAGFEKWPSLVGKHVSVVVETWSRTKNNPETGHEETAKGINIKSVTLL